MQFKKASIFKMLLISIALFSIVEAGGTMAADQPVNIAITPFTINAADDLSYVRVGIQDMLESRLSQEEKITVFSDEETANAMRGIEEPIDQREARAIGVKLGARYVLIGSISVFGSKISLDSKLVDVTGQKDTLTFFEQSDSVDDLVPKINTIASDINTKLFGAKVTASAEDPAQKTAETTGPSSDYWKSRRFKMLINGLALGDVDGDGKIETVIITPDSVIVYKNEHNQMFKTAEFNGGRFRILIGVDVADINGNGYDEIFVTAQNTQKTRVYSTVFEYDGKQFSPTVEDSPWKYRVVEPSPGMHMLLGQKHIDKKPFSGAVFEMRWQASEYQAESQIAPSGNYNLMGFAYGDITGTGENSVVVYDDYDKIRVYADNGEVIWKGDEHYGGSTLSFSLAQGGPVENQIQYLPMRILIKDTTGDGQNEIIAVKNHEIANNALANFRMYNEAEIESFYWDGLGLVSKWKTRKISGYMRDFAIGDLDNDGTDELVATVIQKEGRIVGTTPISVVIAYQF